jgi:LmbE family N-acetylglucosaminyl deacetylase
MATQLKTIIFSPHLDDAVFSVGACLRSEAFGKAKVVNIFTRSKYTVAGLANDRKVTQLRMREDQLAMRQLGVEATYWGFPDTTLKTSYTDESSYLDPSAVPSNDCTWFSVQQHIENEFRLNKHHLFLAPLGIGSHIEHRIVTELCLRFLRSGRKVAFYEDGSYFTGVTKESTSVANRLGLHRYIIIKPVAFSEKQSLIDVYSSQVDRSTRKILETAYVKVQGERLWSTDRVINFASRQIAASLKQSMGRRTDPLRGSVAKLYRTGSIMELL